ncbi:MAG: O-antigen ligase family protein [Gemmatimonadaceae bacterium]|nr:O-antigen ligase family protein [Gemmatimonadaceae bacterium]
MLFALVVIRMGELWPPIAAAKPVVTLTSAIIVLHLMRSNWAAWRRAFGNTQVRLTILYGLIVIALVPTSIWRGRSVGIAMVMPWGMALVLLASLTAPSLPVLDRVVRWFSALTAITAILLVLQGNVVEGSRVTSSGSYDSNDLGGLMALALPLAIGGVLRGPLLARLVAAASALSILTVLMQTGSRGGFLALVAGTLVLLLALSPTRLLLAFVIGLAVVPLGWRLAPSVMRERAASLLSLEEDYNTTSNSGRIYLWKRGLVFAARNPLTGVGPGTFEAQLGRDFEEVGSRGAWHTAHNTIVQALAELGMIGGGLLIYLLGRSVVLAAAFWPRRSPVRRPEFAAALVGYLVAAMFLSHAYSYLLFGAVALTAMMEGVLRVRSPETVPVGHVRQRRTRSRLPALAAVRSSRA